jgi:MSHA biogenesis protein MshQ
LILATLKSALKSALTLLVGLLIYAMPVDDARATITYQSAGAVSYSASVDPPYPASVAAGNLLILIVGMKPSVANGGSVITPIGWTLITSLTGAGGYGATLGADTGNTNVFAYYKVAAGTESGSLSVPLTAHNVAWAQMYRLTNATQDWSVAGTTGTDITAGNVSITMSADPGVTAGDFILGAMVIPTDVRTPTQFSAEAFTQTGVTFGAVTEISEPDSATGNDIGGFVVRSSVTAGTGTAVPVMTATAAGTTTNVRGPGIFIRVRATGAIIYQTPGAINYRDTTAGTAVCALRPASVAAGNLLVTLIGMKPTVLSGGSVTTPSGWTAVSGGSLVGAGGYGAVPAADTGNTNVFSFYRVATGPEATEQCFTLTTNNVSWSQMYRFSSTTQTWQLAGTTGSDITAGSVSITMSANPGVTVGDHILGAMVIPTDVQTPTQFSAEAFAQTGVTFGAVTEVSEPDTTTGNDLGGFVVRSTATAGVGSAAPVMTATAGGTTTNVRGPGVFIRIRDESAFSQAAFRFYDDGTEAGSTAIAAQDTNISRDVAAGNSNLQLRLRAQEINALPGAAVDDFQLQYSKNAGAYTNVTGGSANVRGFNSASLSDGGATTNRLGAGSGSFVAGVIAEDGLADNHQITASNYTEYLFSLTLVSADLANADTLDFRLLRNGVTIAAYSVVPRITITKVTVGSFNAFEPPALPTTCATLPVTTNSGSIKTKISGTTYPLCVVALDTAGPPQILTTFNEDVKVEVVPTTNCLTTGTVYATMPPVTLANGRASVNFSAAVNAWPDASVRISYPTVSPTVTTCSTDSFAIRPNMFASFAVSDNGTWDTAGISRALTDVTFGNVLHKAGRSISVRATAVNAEDSPAITTNYVGAPTATKTACVGAACTATFGTLTLDTTFVAGQLASDVASYDNVGAFALELVDSTFSNVDLSDGSTAGDREIRSGAINVGRFVPDHLAVAYNTPQFAAACNGGFTYIGQAFNYATAPVITVTAKNFADGTATLYTRNWWRITNASLTGKSYTSASGALDTSGITGADPTIGDSGGGLGTLTFGSGTGLLFTRGTPVAPFDADIALTINVIDADGVGSAANPAAFGAAMIGSGISFNSGKSMRYGRLRLLNAYGSELLPLRVPVRTEYFNGTAWTLNTADRCTPLGATAVAIGNCRGSLVSQCTGAGGTPNVGTITPSLTGPNLSNGQGTLILTRPGCPGGTCPAGSVDVALNLRTGAGNDQSCAPWGTAPVSTGANLPWLQFLWCATKLDPNARATCGSPKAPSIYLRERY